MGGRGGSSGLGNVKKPQFEGSEKQVKWANDIIDRAKITLEDSLKNSIELNEYLHISDKEKSNIETEKILNEIANNTLSNLSNSWSAKDVIENRNHLNPRGIDHNSVIDIRQTLGIFERAKYPDFIVKSIKVRDGGNIYDMEKLKSSKSERKKLEKELLSYLKNHKEGR